MVTFKQVVVVSYRLSTVTIAISLNHLAAICRRMSPMLKSTGSGWVTMEQNLEGFDKFNKTNLTQSRRDTRLSYAKEIKSLSFAV